LSLVKEFATAKFAESIDAAVNLGIDASKSDQQVRGSTWMPHGLGKSVRVAVFTSGKNQDAARAAGADLVDWRTWPRRSRPGRSISTW
jgi:large subunit ribosomal protein L1